MKALKSLIAVLFLLTCAVSSGQINVPALPAKFNTLQVIDDISVPLEDWNRGKVLEPIVSYFPDFGSGGGTQVITNTFITNTLLQIPYYKLFYLSNKSG